AEQQRLGRWLAQERAEELYGETRRLVEEAGRQEDRRQGTEDSEAIQNPKSKIQNENSQDLKRLSLRLQAVKAAQRAAREAYEISQDPPPPEVDPVTDDRLALNEVLRILTKLRGAAEEAGLVSRSPNVGQTVESVVKVTLGQWPGIDSVQKGPGTPRWEIAAGLVKMHGERVEKQFRAEYGEGKEDRGQKTEDRKQANPEPQVPNPEPRVPNPEPQAPELPLDPAIEASTACYQQLIASGLDHTSAGEAAERVYQEQKAQQRNIQNRESCANAAAAGGVASAGGYETYGESSAAAPPQRRGEVAPEKSEKLRAGDESRGASLEARGGAREYPERVNDGYADDPLGQLYRRLEQRNRHRPLPPLRY
ncbi:MAG: hypothetical protein L0214_15725, partial [candidate division NC10 bacterium]|nr:hypothetical protein [candidate division NC10 bacterium]